MFDSGCSIKCISFYLELKLNELRMIYSIPISVDIFIYIRIRLRDRKSMSNINLDSKAPKWMLQ